MKVTEKKKKDISRKVSGLMKKKISLAEKKSASENKNLKNSTAKKNQNTSVDEDKVFSFRHQLTAILIAVVGIFIAICFAFPNSVGLLGFGIANGFFGLFGMAAFLVPFLCFQLTIFWKKDVFSGAVKYKYLISLGVLILSAVLLHTFRGLMLHEIYNFGSSFTLDNLKKLFSDGREYHGGGLLGGILAIVVVCCFGYVGTLIFSFLFLIALLMAMFGLTPAECWQRFLAYRERIRNGKELRKQEDESSCTECNENEKETEADETANEASVSACESVNVGEEQKKTDVSELVKKDMPEVDCAENRKPLIQTDPVLLSSVEEETDDFDESLGPRVYEIPPIDLLCPPEEMFVNENDSKELRENADKIIETLDSFHVHVSISHVSKGPTVTRYELEPAAGTRVRSIINLLDDIALSLATSGVRSDGIIAGKSAIGIEVPNKTVNTVYVRELIEDDRFVNAKSRLTTCLGMDVSGAPVYLDVAKMPHLLIAGATGMGKSVCINSLLVSLLYKARPEEVKLILIDPKKVELNIYNGIPHLLVPVVFDPKKAAGALHWAVTEMERRFELIEAKNTRNITQYNAAVADDPTQEVLPQIVIVIDELADLMMSAPDDVESSICRLAQKARAAGMHLIIGTQRPSVDVITGLIKANIPSRIAFTVASQVDSRTIIDMQGAEKLIGRGDMLYSPVGSAKPIRVQGAFVSETEIEEIVGFIRSQSNGNAYSDDVIAQINRAAEICGQKKGRVSSLISEGEADDVDPMIDSAIALAVENGKISTSLIQRRLSLGYGRAAKIIDIMERKGIVGPSEGQKPRAVLITREQYLEMQMNKSDDDSSQTSFDEDSF